MISESPFKLYMSSNFYVTNKLKEMNDSRAIDTRPVMYRDSKC